MHAAQKRLDVFGLTVESLQPVPGCLCADLLVSAWCAQSWKWFTCWAIIRTTGFWPLTVYGESVLPLVLPRCSACGAQHVTVAHALADCPHTATDYLLLSSIAVDMPDRECTPIFFQSLLGECLLLLELEARIRYVGTSVHTVVFGDTVGVASDEELAITEDRMDQLIELSAIQGVDGLNESEGDIDC